MVTTFCILVSDLGIQNCTQLLILNEKNMNRTPPSSGLQKLWLPGTKKYNLTKNEVKVCQRLLIQQNKYQIFTIKPNIPNKEIFIASLFHSMLQKQAFYLKFWRHWSKRLFVTLKSNSIRHQPQYVSATVRR